MCFTVDAICADAGGGTRAGQVRMASVEHRVEVLEHETLEHDMLRQALELLSGERRAALAVHDAEAEGMLRASLHRHTLVYLCRKLNLSIGVPLLLLKDDRARIGMRSVGQGRNTACGTALRRPRCSCQPVCLRLLDVAAWSGTTTRPAAAAAAGAASAGPAPPRGFHRRANGSRR